MKGQKRDFQVHEIICREGEPSDDLFFLESGKVLICVVQGTQVKAIARIGGGEIIGELSFFDGKPRASFVVGLEAGVIVQIPKKDIKVPKWYMEVGQNLTKKIRLLDEVIHSSNLRRYGSEDQKPLTIEEQRLLLEVLTKKQA